MHTYAVLKFDKNLLFVMPPVSSWWW